MMLFCEALDSRGLVPTSRVMLDDDPGGLCIPKSSSIIVYQ